MLNPIRRLFIALIFFGTVSLNAFASPDYWLDVRTPKEFSESHVTNASNIPFDTIAQKISSVTTDKSAEIYLYCGSGRRAGIAEQTLREMGYTNITNVGGIKEALELEKTNKK